MLVGFIGFLVVSILIQAAMVAGFARKLWRAKPDLPNKDLPSAAVVLCLRGGDPFLIQCLNGLLDLDYPEYHVLFMVDHPSDPALEVLDQAIRDRAGERRFTTEILYLDPTLDTCSLKCASFVQAAKHLGDRFSIIAQLDADTIPHSSWLAELVNALADDKVGCATGNRWYMPDRPSLGTMVRYQWNAAAVVQMDWYRIAWGGTIAFKVEAIRKSGLLEKWSKAFCEDTMSYQQLSKHGYELRFVPSLMMINREDSDLGGFHRWVQRQLLTARLYHPAWIAVLAHGISSACVQVIGWGGAIAYLATGQIATGLILGSAMLIYQVLLVSLLVPMELGVRRIARSRGEKADWITARGLVAWSPVMFVTQWVYTSALVRSQFLRTVNWRGISYRIAGPWTIHRGAYQPYAESNSDSINSKESIG
jgi:hypothetical protein